MKLEAEKKNLKKIKAASCIARNRNDNTCNYTNLFNAFPNILHICMATYLRIKSNQSTFRGIVSFGNPRKTQIKTHYRYYYLAQHFILLSRISKH